jgi:phospholipid/cholesterol/gamma-HCH transport system substrate-binding protein
MNAISRRLPSGLIAVVAALLCLAVVAALAVAVTQRSNANTMTVDFERTVSLYEGSTVRILGVDVGTVEKLTPRGQNVRAEISWDAEYEVPADVQAVIVSPSVVGDRFVQLTPAYTGGAKLRDGTHLDQTRTAMPTELDETFAALDKVAVTLGPEGLNKDGSVSKLLESSADNLEGKGGELRESIAALAKLSTTVDGTKDEFFTSIEQIETFVSALETNDASVRRFNSSLAGVSEVLAGEGDDLQLAVRELAGALQQIQGYVAENRGVLRKNISGLKDVTKSLSKQRKNLDRVLEQGPKALSNLAMAYNPTTGTLDARGSIKGSKDRKMTVLTENFYVGAYCALSTRQNPKYQDACDAVTELVGVLADQAQAAGSEAGATPAAAGDEAPAAGASTSETLSYVMGVA